MAIDPVVEAAHRDGDLLVLHEGAALPPRCPLCNSTDVAEPLEVRFAVQRKGGLIGDAVSAGIDRAKGWHYTGPVTILVPFCHRHRARRGYALGAGITLIVIGSVATYAVVQVKTTGLINVFACAPLLIGLFVTFATLTGAMNWWFKARRFDDRRVWATGASPDYLATLPKVDWRKSPRGT